MPEKSYLFYDIETTGLNKCFDQALQFAAIRTDEQLNELERHEINIRLNPDVIPSPYALITHRIGIEQSLQGESELTAISTIHQLMNTPNTISLGYNTLGFDDEFLRFSFYRNLLPPYTHQYANGCGRMDIYPMTLMYYLFKNNCLNWPTIDKKISMKLENINAANHLATGQAHDAMVDVEVTLALAKRLQNDTTMWPFVTQYFNKSIDESRFIQTKTHHTLGNHTVKTGIMISGKLGSANQFMAPVIHCGTHQHYKNQSIWLRLDNNQLFEDNFPIKKRFGEAPIFLPLNERYLRHLTDERQARMLKHLKWLHQHPESYFEQCNIYQHEKYTEFPTRDIDAGLYDIGFPSREASQLCQQFHHADIVKKSAIIEKLNPNHKEQAIRVLGRFNQDLLSTSQRPQYLEYLDNINNQHKTHLPIDYQGNPKYSLQQAHNDIAEIRQNNTLDSEQTQLLNTYEHWINNKMSNNRHT